MSSMKRSNARMLTMTALLSIGSMLSIGGCKSSLPETLPSFDTSRCDPALRTDCVSVSQGFVDRREEIEEALIRRQLDLKACRQALTK